MLNIEQDLDCSMRLISVLLRLNCAVEPRTILEHQPSSFLAVPTSKGLRVLLGRQVPGREYYVFGSLARSLAEGTQCVLMKFHSSIEKA